MTFEIGVLIKKLMKKKIIEKQSWLLKIKNKNKKTQNNNENPNMLCLLLVSNQKYLKKWYIFASF